MKDEPIPCEALVVNAHSHREGGELFGQAPDKLERVCVRLWDARVVHDREHLIPTAREAARSGVPMVIVGDRVGSLSSYVDERVGHDCVFAILPRGTANSLTRLWASCSIWAGRFAPLLPGNFGGWT